MRALVWYGYADRCCVLKVIVLTVAVGDVEGKSQSTPYCVRNCHHCTLWSIDCGHG